MDNRIGKPMNRLFNKVYENGMIPLKRREHLNKSLETLQSNKLQENNVSISPVDEEKYSRILKGFNMPVKEDLLKGLKILDFHGIHLTKENLIQFMSTKNQVSDLVKELNYDTALKLMKEEVDLEKDSLQEVVDKLQKIKQEEQEKPLSLSKILKGLKNPSTEEAEKIAQQIYGSKQGKDITDIIKALHQAGVEITKENIEKINVIFMKLHNIKGYDQEGLIEVIKHQIETNLNQLYKFKNSIKRGAIAIEEKLSQYATRIYDGFLADKGKPTEGDLKKLEGDIKEILVKDGQEVTTENVMLSKSLIRQGMEVTGENIQKVLELKTNIEAVVNSLDQEKIAILVQAGYDLETENLVRLMELVKETDVIRGELQLMETLSPSEEEKITEILGKVKVLGEIKEEELLLLLKKNHDIKISDLQKINPSAEQEVMTLKEGIDVHYSAIKVMKLFTQVNKLDLNSLTNHMRNNVPLTMEGLGTNVNDLLIATAKPSRNDVQQAFKELNFIREHLTSSMVVRGIEKGLSLEKLELPKLSSYINDCNLNLGNWEQIKILPQIHQQGDNILALLMKNSLPINLAEMKQMSHFLKNQQQMGHQLQELSDLIEREGKDTLRSEIPEIKEMVKGVTRDLKLGKMDLARFHKELQEIIKNIADKGSQMEEQFKEELNKNINKLTDVIDKQNQLNQRDTTLQMPFMMENQMKNLQIYIMKEKQGGKKIDPKNMSVLLNMDTNYLGNINIYLGVNYKQLVLKVGVLRKEYQETIEPHIPALKEMLSKVGYEVKDIAFRVDEDLHLMSMVEEVAEKQKGVHFIDMMI